MSRLSLHSLLWLAVPLAFALGVLAERQEIPSAVHRWLPLPRAEHHSSTRSTHLA